MRRRGFLLITALLAVVVLLLLGFGLLGSQAARFRGTPRAAESAQARALAMAGLEDARAKLENDVSFPPAPAGEGQDVFSYSERMDLPGTLGSYTVILDRSHEGPPYQVLHITAIGSLGRPDLPTAQHTLKAELDLSPVVRGTSNPNPRFFRFTHLEDESSL